MKAYSLIILLSISFISCAPRQGTKQNLDAQPEAETSYILSSFRPQENLRKYLSEVVAVQPNNVIYHRDLGTWYQSRMTLVTGELKTDYIKRSVDHLERAYAQMPEDPQTLIYYGLALASKATLKETPAFTRLQIALRGFRLMDQAVAKDPENFSVRLLRAKANSMAPLIMARGSSMAQDYTWIRGQLDNNDDLPIHLQTLGVIFIGDYFFEQKKDRQKAMAQWKKAAGMDSSFAEEATWRLEGTIPGFESFKSKP